MLSARYFPDTSLYIHFPWCVKKCPYCDFNSHELKHQVDEERYIDALITDFDSCHASISGRYVKSVFLGGGTPSLFSGQSLARLLHHIRNNMSCHQNMEVTLEVNPGTVEHDSFDAYLRAGISRLSLGVQSFDNACLAAIGRIHDNKAAWSAVQQAYVAGFENFNIDLMFGLPGQNSASVILDCQAAVECAPQHISYYQLTVEPNTVFHRYPPRLPGHDAVFNMQQDIQNILAKSGFARYEVSAYARPGMECQHNFHYWQFGDYLGIGAGAHSKITVEGDVIRSWNEKHPERYQSTVESGNAWRHAHTVPGNQLLFEFMLNALRLTCGFSLDLCQQRTGLSQEAIMLALNSLSPDNLLMIENNQIRCSAKGYLFIDEILQQLLP